MDEERGETNRPIQEWLRDIPEERREEAVREDRE
jgi:hypothetical protein